MNRQLAEPCQTDVRRGDRFGSRLKVAVEFVSASRERAWLAANRVRPRWRKSDAALMGQGEMKEGS